MATSAWLVSTYVVCERLSVMHKQVSGWTVNFCPNFPESPFLEFQTRKLPPPHFRKLQIWDDQSLLRNTPPPFWKTSDLRWPKFTPKYPPLFRKLQIWDDQSLLRNTPPPFRKTSDLRWPKFTLKYPPFWKTSDLRWPKFTLKYPPFSENFRFEMTKVYSEIPHPHFGKLQIWDDQSLLRNTPPFWKTSDLRWPKFTSKYPLPPHFRKLQIWEDQSLLWNTPPFRKLQIWDDQSLL